MPFKTLGKSVSRFPLLCAQHPILTLITAPTTLHCKHLFVCLSPQLQEDSRGQGTRLTHLPTPRPNGARGPNTLSSAPTLPGRPPRCRAPDAPHSLSLQAALHPQELRRSPHGPTRQQTRVQTPGSSLLCALRRDTWVSIFICGAAARAAYRMQG